MAQLMQGSEPFTLCRKISVHHNKWHDSISVAAQPIEISIFVNFYYFDTIIFQHFYDVRNTVETQTQMLSHFVGMQHSFINVEHSSMRHRKFIHTTA